MNHQHSKIWLKVIKDRQCNKNSGMQLGSRALFLWFYYDVQHTFPWFPQIGLCINSSSEEHSNNASNRYPPTCSHFKCTHIDRKSMGPKICPHLSRSLFFCWEGDSSRHRTTHQEGSYSLKGSATRMSHQDNFLVECLSNIWIWW